MPAFWPSARGIWLLLIVCVLLALSSVWTAFGVLAAVALGAVVGLVVLDVRAGPRVDDIVIARRHDGYAAVGRAGQVTYELENRSGSPLEIEVAEAPSRVIAFDQDVASFSVAQSSRLESGRGFLARERGAADFAQAYVRVRNGVGLIDRRFVLDAALNIRVYPDFSAVEGYGTLARRSTLLEAGLRRLRFRGAGTEFESLRDYESGDAFRTIDWKATARRGRLMVAQYDVERSQNIIIAVDAGRLMTPRLGRARKFDYALTAGLSAARVAHIAGDNVGFVAFAARPLLHVVPQRGLRHHAALVQAAYDLQPLREEPDYETLAADLRRRYAKRSLIIVFTDLFDPAWSQAVIGSLSLLARRHLVLCALMNDGAVNDALVQPPSDVRGAYRVAMALRLAEERRAAITSLRSGGMLVVDVPAERLTIALLDAYLDVKARGLL